MQCKSKGELEFTSNPITFWLHTSIFLLRISSLEPKSVLFHSQHITVFLTGQLADGINKSRRNPERKYRYFIQMCWCNFISSTAKSGSICHTHQFNFSSLSKQILLLAQIKGKYMWFLAHILNRGNMTTCSSLLQLLLLNVQTIKHKRLMHFISL